MICAFSSVVITGRGFSVLISANFSAIFFCNSNLISSLMFAPTACYHEANIRVAHT